MTLLATKLLNQTLATQDSPFWHFGLTNAPGPTMPLYLCGAKLQLWTVVTPLSAGLGLVFGVTSYLDKLSISFTADRMAVPDPDFLEACIDRSFAAHVTTCGALLLKQPELPQQPQRRRVHPGLAAMSQGAATAAPAHKSMRKAARKTSSGAAAKPALARTTASNGVATRVKAP